MKALLPSSHDLSELDSVEVKKPQDNKTYQRCNKSSAHGSLSQNGSSVLSFLRRNGFVVLTMTAVALGTGLGSALRQMNMSDRNVKYLTFPGELLLRILQMLVLPLIVSSVVAGMSSVNREAYGKIGLRAFSYYMVTTIIAAFTGITVAVIIQPGKSFRKAPVSSNANAEAVQTVDSFLDLIRNMFPSNLVEACFRKYKTAYSRSVSTVMMLGVNMTENIETGVLDIAEQLKDGEDISHIEDNTPVSGTIDGVNILGLLCFSITFGLILGRMGTEAKPLRDFFDALSKAIMCLVNIVIWYSPVGILFLLAGQVVKMTDIGEIGGEVAMYALSVITGLLIHSLITLPLIYFTVTRKNPFRFMLGLLQVLTTAFGTSSSYATLPVTIYCMEEIHNIDKQVTRCILPIAATMNMDGAALYEALAALFIAQVNNMEFNLGQMIVLSLIVTAASTGGAGIPQAGMVSVLIVLESVGLPTEDISLLLLVDWMLERLRTSINVLGDCVGVSVVQHLSRHELQRSSPAEQSLVEKTSRCDHHEA